MFGFIKRLFSKTAREEHDLRFEVEFHLSEGSRVDAIKVIRRRTGMGLKDSVDYLKKNFNA